MSPSRTRPSTIFAWLRRRRVALFISLLVVQLWGVCFAWFRAEDGREAAEVALLRVETERAALAAALAEARDACGARPNATALTRR